MKARHKLPSPGALMYDMAKVDQIRAWLGEARDVESVLATIESETDALEKLDIIVDEWESDKTNAEKGRARAIRIEARANKAKFLAQQIMEKFGVAKLERPAYTATIGQGVPSLVITDEKRIPPRLMRPDKDAIKAELKGGKEVPGCSLNNSPPTLRITMK